MGAIPQDIPHYEQVVIGTGPTGLGAAWRLYELGKKNWIVVDACPTAGGLACSVVDDQGFTWDMGGHVIFSHYEYFDKLLESLKPKDHWLDHIRESWVWMRKKFIPYPLQNNAWQLPEQDLIPVLDGLVKASQGAYGDNKLPCKNFDDWIVRSFGEGLANAFMRPYNFKVWAVPTSDMTSHWVGERVATVDLSRILKNMVLKQDDAGWGPNATFRFPLHGGTGSIWSDLYDRIPKEFSQMGNAVVKVDAERHILEFADGKKISYGSLISTMPLDLLCKSLVGLPEIAAKASKLRYSSSHIIGIGVEGKPPANLSTKCWLYFPEEDCPFYRVTVFSNYSPYNVPKPGEQYSLMCEVSESPVKPVNSSTLVEETIKGLINVSLLPADAKVVSKWHTRLEHGYPTPHIGRDDIFNEVDAALMKYSIYSRGRFGAWKYEVANQDHSMMQGVEVVDHILFGSEELTVRNPNMVNAKKSLGRKNLLLIQATEGKVKYF
mmetsp:Transcript_39907/g.64702  ORF Transcript_39907/g.64702 Transcript_39907/m.64702 type:complete len:492 (+) Transcript_39907:135-1610(+)|eukprot:CAMPEP_0184656972 /NCGR_PEP_ID=MMETSP0308-20130426/16878_1 /TAXON_ID=38269 /ORGANISM="Gloeochaete witrockiana, Strain SAG 46.84" /LENGTH=491 /DNA_ID=CAMNT_0027094317 /DNA_START=122 /DNA_END=1597 /DNA_ORIENTATION=+